MQQKEWDRMSGNLKTPENITENMMEWSAGTQKVPAMHKWFAKNKRNLAFTAMVLPGALWLILLRYLPMFGIPIAFKTFQGPDAFYQRTHSYLADIFVNPAREWTLSNYEALFRSPTTWCAIRNTVCYNLFYIVVGTIIAVAFAIMLNELTRRFVAKTYQTLMFFPYFLSWVVASYFFMAFLQDGKGILDTPSINFYTTAEPWPIIIIISFIWKMTGYSTVLYLASITSIDTMQYEAASIDGASKWQQIWTITIPNLRPIILILFIMNIGKVFNSDISQFWQLPLDGGIGRVPEFTETLDTLVYRLGINGLSMNMGLSTAVSFLQNVVGFVFIMLSNAVVRRIDRDSSLF
ncbi:MAG: ABC transporter permease subunit [Clostridia bacterium]|nr:ABC transporter permease subunit [Clostridia bacterium]